jgi:hypothetical protein
MRSKGGALLCLSILATIAVATACGDDDDGQDATDTPPGTVSVEADLTPPLEGPPRGPPAATRVDYRELPEWQLPLPADAAAPVGDDLAALVPPTDPDCPAGWQQLVRSTENFMICYPPGWELASHGYVSEGSDERWYSTGFYLFADGAPVAHVSVYAFPRYSRPVRHTIDCPQPYSVELSGEPAVLCPEAVPSSAGEKIVSYQARFGEVDYFVNAVTHAGASEAETAEALATAHTFRFLDAPGG